MPYGQEGRGWGSQPVNWHLGEPMDNFWLLAWLIATSILAFFISTYGWKSLAKWQRSYVIAAAIIVPIALFEHTFWVQDSSSTFLAYAMLALMLSYFPVLAIGIVIGVFLLLKMTNERTRNPN